MKRPLTLDEAYGEWVAAMDNFNDRKKISAHRLELLDEAEARWTERRDSARDAQDQLDHALELLKEAQANFDASIRALKPEQAVEEMNRLMTSATRPRS